MKGLERKGKGDGTKGKRRKRKGREMREGRQR